MHVRRISTKFQVSISLRFGLTGPNATDGQLNSVISLPRERPYNKHKLISHSRKKVPVHYGWTPFKMQHIKRYAVTY